ncbi:calcium-binding protein [Tateyamaria sp. syn59]|uniref:calcium-binding protein n=1 Tax=Tateyamaria sp. syn59 TaxID=2576942 RepID=UPI0011BF1084|nr:calcium-binding protein [Tateyamaria sp. syn59]
MPGPTIRFSNGISPNILIFDTIFDELFNTVTLTSEGATEAVFETSTGATITLQGSGFAYVGSIEERQLVGGTLNALIFEVSPGVTVEMTGIAFDVPSFAAIYQQDASGADPAALENFLMPMDWTILGNDGATEFRNTAVSSDGVPLTFSGDNTVELDGGFDIFDAGAGNDTVSGGLKGDLIWGRAGNDVLNGDEGNDTLLGGADSDLLNGGSGSDSLNGGNQQDTLIGGNGNDTLVGGNQRDELRGSKGDDSLNGGAAKDVLIGGSGDDTMTGGSSADRFVFVKTAAGQEDVITDFDASQDRIRIYGENNPGTATFQDLGDDLLVTYGTNSILIENTEEADLTSTNFLFL